MAQDEYGAAQPLADWTKKYVVGPVKAVVNTIDKIPSPSKPDDSAYHADMLKQANDTFRKQQEDEKGPKKALPRKKLPRKR